jgi:hypothetical protein
MSSIGLLQKEISIILFKFVVKNHFNVLNGIYQKNKQVVISSIDSQNINAKKPHTSNSTTCNFNHFYEVHNMLILLHCSTTGNEQWRRCIQSIIIH